MSIRNDSTALASSLVFAQYSLCHYAGDVNAVLRDLRRLRRSSNHPSAAFDPAIDRLNRLAREIREEISSIDEQLDPRKAGGELVAA